MASTSTPGTAIICTAQVTYKKQPSYLSLTPSSLLVSSTPNGPPSLTIPTNRMIVLFASKPTAPKVALKIALSPTSLTQITEESYNFQFTAGASAVSDRERFKKELGEMVAANRARGGIEGGAGDGGASAEKAEERDVKPDLNATGGAAGGGTPNADPKGKGKERPPTTTSTAPTPTSTSMRPSPSTTSQQPQQQQQQTDYHLRKLILQSSPHLLTLHRSLVLTHQLTESDFWSTRQDLLSAARVAHEQLKGKKGGMVDPKPETDERGDVTVKITPQLTREIFEEYPVVARAYDENVPEPLTEEAFWTRYFQSKLFNRNRTANRAAVNTVKDDAIFDRYLGEEDDDIEPKNLQHHDIYRLLDLAATEEDQHEVTNQRDVTMRPGRERAALPLMRRFNEHSERLLNSSLGESVDRNRISFDPGNAGDRNSLYYSDILLDDLIDRTVSDRVALNLGGAGGAAGGATGGGGEGGGKGLMDEVQAQKTVKRTREIMEDWESGLGEFKIDPQDVKASMGDMMASVRQKVERGNREGGAHNTIPRSLLTSLTQVCATSHEFLRLFWGSVLPPKPNDLSALALSSPKERAARAERFKGSLENSLVRLGKVAEQPEGERRRSEEEQRRVEAALIPTREAVEHAIAYYNSRVGV
ncbi:hypothetical protein BCR35DRAFT_300243 [Leucosporidium creatinivorum]|uniref:BSD domain-containing protein n=1 Tax=Leucosporidium creatinivorum TaxID=106004 RepID=A0A1Y2G2D5_9BASI|nr:hypothetical protein BCR35DRAFT_300243 [Leucosporidium creatinivorum]